MLLMQGCLSSSQQMPDRSAPVEVFANGDISVEGRSTPLPRLVASLKARGYTPENTFYILAPNNLPERKRAEISSVLLSAGYRKFMFKGQRKALSSVEKLPTN